MPELPEVETVRRDLARAVLGKRLVSVEVREPRLLQRCELEQVTAALCGQVLRRVDRRGKFLVFDFGPFSALVHLRMTGWFALEPGTHTRMVLSFERGLALYFDDTRRFGTLHLVPSDELFVHPPLAGLGLEPLGDAFTLDAFSNLFHTERPVKLLLLDQTRVTGLGNIYVCEALFRAGVHPRSPANALDTKRLKSLHKAIREVLREAIQHHGSTLGSSVGDYRTLSGAQGGFQDRFQVYGREGEPCLFCGAEIERITQGQRSSFYCPVCQT